MMTKHEIESLFKVHYASMYRLAVMLLHDEELARDIIHDVFVALLTGNISHTVVGVGYLMSCIRNRCVNYMRDLDTRQRVRALYLLDVDRCDDVSWPDEALIALVRRIIDTELTEQCRRVVVMRFYRNMGYAEIASTLGISEAAVYKHLRHAIDKIRKKTQ